VIEVRILFPRIQAEKQYGVDLPDAGVVGCRRFRTIGAGRTLARAISRSVRMGGRANGIATAPIQIGGSRPFVQR
jgi:hypothetical protein